MSGSKTKTPTKPKRVSMQAIAKKAGVSTTTVSLAMRGHESISEETKSRIQEVQQSMGYQFTGRRLKSQLPYRPNLEQIVYRTIGVDMREENYSPFLSGVVGECRQLGIKLELDNVPTASPPKDDSLVPGVASKRGVIISGRLSDKDIAHLEESGLAYVVLGNYFFPNPIHMVGINIPDLATRMIRRLHEQNVKRFVFFVEVANRPFDQEILRYLRLSLLDQGVARERISVFEGGPAFKDIAAATEAINAQVQLGARIVTIEKHCAEALMLAQRTFPHSGKDWEISSFVGTPLRFPMSGLETFDLGLEHCGRLAVARLAELQRYPGLPPSCSYIHSPGWT